VLHPQSSAAHDIATLWWGMLAAAGIVFAGVLALIIWSVARRKREGMPPVGTDEQKLGGLVVGFGIVIPVLALAALFYIANIGVVNAISEGKTKLTIDVVARQWFWEARYPASGAVTANEIHIPAGTPVRVVVTSPDVIHSFWVPELNRKIDAIPGHPNSLELDAHRPGVYRGQCAEFCGLQHANMAMAIFADPPAKFRAWLANMAKPVANRGPGLQTFMNNQCASCHTLRGTAARGDIGPDLTHVATRKTLAALTIPNDPAHMAEWISNPQKVKPGNKMPGLPLSQNAVRQLTTFLEGLK
jgi:cytochrome c oxidase subunit II